MGDGVDHGLVHHLDVVGVVFGAVASGPHEVHDEGDSRVDLVGDRTAEAFGAHQVVGRQAGAAIAGCLDIGGRQSVGGVAAEAE